jgi:short-subunit dehydrogenase
MDTGIMKNSKHISNDKREREILFLQKNRMSPGKAAKRIVKKIMKGKYRIVVGSFMFWIDLVSRLFPADLQKLTGSNKKRINFV